MISIKPLDIELKNTEDFAKKYDEQINKTKKKRNTLLNFLSAVKLFEFCNIVILFFEDMRLCMML